MKNVSQSYGDPKKFWKQIKRLKGSKAPASQHLIKNNIKLMENNEKEEAFREILQNVFKITQEENARYYIDTEREVVNFLSNNEFYLNTYDHSNLHRLQGEQQIDTLITYQKIEMTIKSFKNNTPGETKINKIILSNTPRNALIKLQWLFNHTLSMGHFPKHFKTAILKLIHKPNTDPTNATNYRPVNYTLFMRTQNILNKLMNLDDEHFQYLLDNYEEERNHAYILNSGPPLKKYTA